MHPGSVQPSILQIRSQCPGGRAAVRACQWAPQKPPGVSVSGEGHQIADRDPQGGESIQRGGTVAEEMRWESLIVGMLVFNSQTSRSGLRGGFHTFDPDTKSQAQSSRSKLGVK